jgi:hypothetical protein
MNPYESPETEAQDQASSRARKRRNLKRLGIILIFCGVLLMIDGFCVLNATYHARDPKEQQILERRVADLGSPILLFGTFLTAAGALCLAAASKLNSGS